MNERINTLRHILQGLEKDLVSAKKKIDLMIKSVKNEKSKDLIKNGSSHIFKLWELVICDMMETIIKEEEDAEVNTS